MKRLFDVVASLAGVVLLSPLYALIALLVRLSSPGPVVYRQVRVGLHGRDFVIYKFRTMYPDADKRGLLTVGGRDPRVTPVGHYLRKYKLDELTQLFNVLKGDMSLVGPRPEVRKYVNLYTPEQMRVLSVRPGITDRASLLYRDESELLATHPHPEHAYIHLIMPEKLRLNLTYVDRHNFWGDVKIILQTLLFAVFKVETQNNIQTKH